MTTYYNPNSRMVVDSRGINLEDTRQESWGQQEPSRLFSPSKEQLGIDWVCHVKPFSLIAMVTCARMATATGTSQHTHSHCWGYFLKAACSMAILLQLQFIFILAILLLVESHTTMKNVASCYRQVAATTQGHDVAQTLVKEYLCITRIGSVM